MYCCDGWIQGTTATVIISIHAGLQMPAVVAAGLVPFPSGEGAVGYFFDEGWRVSGGMSESTVTGRNGIYPQFQIGATSIGNNSDPFNMSFSSC